MDYKSYKAMCDSTLQQIRKSENKREELSDKLQKMYQEKSECEKSIIKTLQSQQKQFKEEKRRREQRNENILRTLERIDYQAHLLAAKTERLRALKKQYERYLLGLWATRRMNVLPIENQLTGTFVKPFTGKYDESPIHQSSYYNHPTFPTPTTNLSYLSQAYPPSFESTFVTATTHTPTYHHYNQSHYSRVLLTPTAVSENSIKAGNYLATTGAPANDRDSQSQFPYSFASVSTTMPVEKKSDNVPINSGDMNLATTINSIYSPRQCSDLPLAQQIPSMGFQSIYQQNSQPLTLENYDYNSAMKMSKSPYNKNDNVNPLIMPAAAVAASQILTTPQQQQQPLSSPSSFENRLKNEMKFDSVHMSDASDSGGEEMENDNEKCNVARRNSPLLEIPPTSISDSALLRRKSIEKSDMTTTLNNIETRAINDESGNMHQVWEKVIEEPTPVLESPSTAFVIPKIIVETQLDVAEATAIAINSPEDIITAKVDSDTTKMPLNEAKKEHSGDNGASTATSNNSPIMEVESSIYHYDKQPVDDEQQHSSIESELRKFNDLKISADDGAGVTMTRETEIKSNNSADKINDDNENQPAIALNDKISEIYRKIERIEGEFYEGKEKIIENFEKRMSSSSPTHDAAKFTSEPAESSSAEEISQENVNQSEFELQEKQDEHQIESTQSNYEFYSKEVDQQSSEVQGEIHPPADYQPMFDNNQYADPVSKSNDEVVDGGELQATFVEYPSSTEMQYQQPSSQDYYATGFEQEQQAQPTEYDYTQYEQLNSNYEQNNNYETTENLSNYNESSAGVYYDQNQTQIYDDQNYSNQQNEIEPTQSNEYFYQQQQSYDNTTDTTATAYLQDGNYYGNSGEFIETSNAAYTTDDGTYGNVDVYRESQVPLESTNYDDTSQQYVEGNNEYERQQNYIAVDDDESFNATTTSSESSKPSVDMEMSAVASASTKREDVKLVKQLLDSESDDTTSRSNLLNTAIKEEEKEDESDFDFSTN